MKKQGHAGKSGSASYLMPKNQKDNKNIFIEFQETLEDSDYKEHSISLWESTMEKTCPHREWRLSV